MSRPKVTIVISCYNYAEYVKDAIISAVKQTYSNLEVVVINDGSTDQSDRVIRSLLSSYSFKYVNHENKGIVHVRNEALELVDGEYLCFLDADDYFDEDYIQKMVETAERYSADVVYPNWRVFGDNEYKTDYEEFSIESLIRQRIHCTSESLIRTSAIGDHKFASERVAEDWDFFIGLALKGAKFKLAGNCYINYRVRKDTRSSKNEYWDDMYIFVEILQKWQKLYPDKVNPIDLPVYAGRIRDNQIRSQEAIIQEKDEAIIHYKGVIEDQKSLIQEVDSKLRLTEARINEILNSKSYRMYKKILKPFKILKRASSMLKLSLTNVNKVFEDAKMNKRYATQTSRVKSSSSSDKPLAVVIHLYYLDNWPLFVEKLNKIPTSMYDLYITLPKSNERFTSDIYEKFSDARIIISPNRGRDVLPFMKVLEIIGKSNYKSILKFHSKKSTHREDGQEWLESMLDEIIPDDPKVLDEVLSVVLSKNFGVLGPESVYYPLTINYPANRIGIMKVLSDIYSEDRARLVSDSRKSYGFFGGTMLWMNADLIVDSLLKYSNARYFDSEAGQIDGTFAHAVERLLCLIPELEGADVYQSDGRSVVKRSYSSDNIPEWSTEHDL